MDPWAPINGISLERYAELSAEASGTRDPNAQADIVGKLGVRRSAWEAAKAGWTARMQDVSLMGQVTTRFMPLYQAALARNAGGAPQVTGQPKVVTVGGASGSQPGAGAPTPGHPGTPGYSGPAASAGAPQAPGYPQA